MAETKLAAKEKKAKAPKYVYEGKQHFPGDEKPTNIKLTEADLDPRQDPVLGVLFAFTNGSSGAYSQMPAMRNIIQCIKANDKNLVEELIRFKKRGRIPTLAQLKKG
jgi:hypothetical protein